MRTDRTASPLGRYMDQKGPPDLTVRQSHGRRGQGPAKPPSPWLVRHELRQGSAQRARRLTLFGLPANPASQGRDDRTFHCRLASSPRGSSSRTPAQVVNEEGWAGPHIAREPARLIQEPQVAN